VGFYLRKLSSSVAKPIGTVNFSADEVEKLRQMARLGISRIEAARRLRRSPSTVIRRVREMGLAWRQPPARTRRPKPPPKAPAGRRWTDADDARLRELVAAGSSIDRAAKDLDRQASYVWLRAERLGLRWSRSRRPI
jgi:transposase